MTLFSGAVRVIAPGYFRAVVKVTIHGKHYIYSDTFDAAWKARDAFKRRIAEAMVASIDEVTGPDFLAMFTVADEHQE